VAEPLKATQFASVLISSTSFADLYTVPAGHRIILKSAVLVATGPANTVLLNIRSPAARVGTLPLGAFGTSAGNFEWRPWLVVGEGQIISAAMLASGSAWCTLSGSLLFI
jgi:hypothetical protein